MRFGLVGTGPWPRITTGPGIEASGSAELVGVWGRSPDKAAATGAELGAQVFASFDDLLDQVEAVLFSVAPVAQPDLAVRAAQAGKHLLLDKPIALDVAGAHAIRDAVAAADVAALVFFTDRFTPSGRSWFSGLEQAGGWRSGAVRWLGALQEEGNPFGASPWRQELGAFWDLAPHVISTLSAAVGPIARIGVTRGEGDLVHLVLHHGDGRTSTSTMTQFAPPAAAEYEALVWGEAGLSRMPDERTNEMILACARAVDDVVAMAESGEREHPCDLRLGVHVVELMAAATAELSAPRHAEAG